MELDIYLMTPLIKFLFLIIFNIIIKDKHVHISKLIDSHPIDWKQRAQRTHQSKTSYLWWKIVNKITKCICPTKANPQSWEVLKSSKLEEQYYFKARADSYSLPITVRTEVALCWKQIQFFLNYLNSTLSI